MTAYYQSKGKSLHDGLIELYEEVGYYREGLHSVTREGKDGQEQIAAIMNNLRHKTPTEIAGIEVVAVEDYEVGVRRCLDGSEEVLTLRQENVIKFMLADDTWVCVRPSGTEPKCKFYVGVKKESSTEGVFAVEEILEYVNKEMI